MSDRLWWMMPKCLKKKKNRSSDVFKPLTTEPTMVIRIKKLYSETSWFRHIVSHEHMSETMIMEYELSCPDLYIDDVLVTRKATMGVRGFDGDYVTSNNEVAGALTNQTFVLGHDVIFFRKKMRRELKRSSKPLRLL